MNTTYVEKTQDIGRSLKKRFLCSASKMKESNKSVLQYNALCNTGALPIDGQEKFRTLLLEDEGTLTSLPRPGSTEGAPGCTPEKF